MSNIRRRLPTVDADEILCADLGARRLPAVISPVVSLLLAWLGSLGDPEEPPCMAVRTVRAAA
jgi:hypothetical protein